MEIGVAYDLKSSFTVAEGDPIDRLEEYDDVSTVDGIARAIEIAGHRPRRLGGGRVLVQAVLDDPPDLVFNITEGFGTRSREAHVPALMELLGVPYSHSDPLTLALTLDKALTKQVLAARGIPTPAFAVVGTVEEVASLTVPLPAIAKPLWEGSSMGIRKTSRVETRARLEQQVERLLGDYHQPVLVEAFCPGPELTVAVWCGGPGGRPAVVGTMEIAPRQDRPEEFIYSLEVKRDYLNQVEYHVPPRLPAAVVERAEALALSVFSALECRDVARVDLRLDGAGQPQFLEVNPLPGLNPTTGDIVILAGRRGLSHEALVGGILQSALARHRL